MLCHRLSLCRMTPSICQGEVCVTGLLLKGKPIACTCFTSLLSPITPPSSHRSLLPPLSDHSSFLSPITHPPSHRSLILPLSNHSSLLSSITHPSSHQSLIPPLSDHSSLLSLITHPSSLQSFIPPLSDHSSLLSPITHPSSSSTPQQWLQYAHTLCNGCHGNSDPVLPERTSFELFLSLLAAVLKRGGDLWRQLKGR